MAVNKLSRISNASSISRRRIAITNRACQEQWPILLRSQVLWTVSWLQKDRFFLFSLSLFPLPFPLPSCPVHGKARGSGEGSGDAEGWRFSARNKQSGNGSFDRKFHLAPSRGWPSSLTTLPFHSPFHWREGGREGGREMVVGFFPNDYAKWKQPFLHCLLVPFPIENDRSRRNFFIFRAIYYRVRMNRGSCSETGGFICNNCGIIVIIIIIASIWLEILIGINSFLFSNG